MSANLLLLLFFVSMFSYGQNTADFKAFVKRFPKTHLPAEVLFFSEELNRDHYTPEAEHISDSTAVSDIWYVTGVLPKGDSLVIPYNQVTSFLLPDSLRPYIPAAEINSGSDTIYPVYYVSARLMAKSPFILLVYERQYNGVFEGSDAEKYLCILNKKGMLIDTHLLASFHYGGTAMADDQMRIPWFPEVKGYVTKDLLFVVTDENGTDVSYLIDGNGQISPFSGP